jgi:hypothetical protein
LKLTAFVGIQKPWQRVRALAGLPDLRIHDLRHAFASAAVASGDSLLPLSRFSGGLCVRSGEQHFIETSNEAVFVRAWVVAQWPGTLDQHLLGVGA